MKYKIIYPLIIPIFSGFIGCIRSVRINNEVIDLHKAAQHFDSQEIHLSCPDKCHSDLCKNDAECLDNISVSSYCII